jgi:hypothetical protein
MQIFPKEKFYQVVRYTGESVTVEPVRVDYKIVGRDRDC